MLHAVLNLFPTTELGNRFPRCKSILLLLFLNLADHGY
jgi:hypothetical protein